MSHHTFEHTVLQHDTKWSLRKKINIVINVVRILQLNNQHVIWECPSVSNLRSKAATSEFPSIKEWWHHFRDIALTESSLAVIHNAQAPCRSSGYPQQLSCKPSHSWHRYNNNNILLTDCWVFVGASTLLYSLTTIPSILMSDFFLLFFGKALVAYI